MEHTITFRNLLKQHVEHSHSPSYYARMMNISLMYLNEAVKGTTGFSVSQNIQYEIVTRAKRSLIYTSKSVKEIAQELGFEDYAYFTRLFSKTAGISPTDFRKTINSPSTPLSYPLPPFLHRANFASGTTRSMYAGHTPNCTG